MRKYQHKLAGIFPDSGAVKKSEQLFREQGFGDQQVKIIQSDDSLHAQHRKIESESGGVRDEFVRDIIIGVAAGGMVGVVAAVVIGLVLPGLYASAAVTAPLMVFVYAVTIGGVIGAIYSLHLREDVLTSTVEEALHEGYPVLMIHAVNRKEVKKAHKLMQSTSYLQEAKY